MRSPCVMRMAATHICLCRWWHHVLLWLHFEQCQLRASHVVLECDASEEQMCLWTTCTIDMFFSTYMPYIWRMQAFGHALAVDCPRNTCEHDSCVDSRHANPNTSACWPLNGQLFTHLPCGHPNVSIIGNYCPYQKTGHPQSGSFSIRVGSSDHQSATLRLVECSCMFAFSLCVLSEFQHHNVHGLLLHSLGNGPHLSVRGNPAPPGG